MTQHFLRLKWMPSDESELLAAFNGGLLEEKNWCDLKRELGPGKGANAELGRDLASFAVYGGTLIIGLDERCAGGSPLAPVDLSAVTPERIEQVAAWKVDPPLTVECTVISAQSSRGAGYVLVHVPVSPLAPHQVDGKYMGRSDKTKRNLSDAEVATLMRLRQQASDLAERSLTAFVRADPIHEQPRHAHLFLIAKPARHDTEMLRPLIEDDGRCTKVNEMLHAIRSRQEIQAMNPPGTEFRLVPDVLTHCTSTADGFKLAPEELSAEPDRVERWAASLEICEDGGLRYYDLHVSTPTEWQGSQRAAALYLAQILTTCRQFLALVAELSDSYGFAGSWQVGTALTNLHGMQAASMPGLTPTLVPPTCTGPNHTQITGASVRELHEHPGRVTDRLLGRLCRSLRVFTPDAFIDRSSASAASANQNSVSAS